ncbi:MAG: OmpA family protein [Legionellaceae bacterium]|nr:OmpA family protein [Legionellaceae bacterium]
MSGNKPLVVFMLLSMLLLHVSVRAASALERHYASPMGKEQWTMSGNRLRCGLSLGIPDYGVAYFEQYATQDPHFIVHKFQQAERRLPATVTARPPVWKPHDKSWFVAKTTVKPGKYGLYLERSATLKLLNYLANGLRAVFQYRSDQGFAVTLSLSPVHFQEVYRKYQRCVGHLLPFNFDDVRESVFHFGLDAFELNAEDKKQLRRIALYSRVDPSITTIMVSGYTDITGRKSYNNAISELRAQAVADYLRGKGVRKHLLQVTWYGVKYPVASNDSEAGRAANRRVLVQMLRKDE